MTCSTLVRLPNFKPASPLLLVIMDGVGIGYGDEADAVALAKKPNLNRLATQALSTQLRAHGRYVGMPSDSDMGNSEVGHNALGAGRIFDQGAKLVSMAIENGSLFSGSVWRSIMERCVGEKHTLHFLGLLSDGNVHSHINHLLALLKEASHAGVQQVRIHALLDGRDVPKTSAHLYIQQLEQILATINALPQRSYHVASGGGRMITTMDRYEADWSIVERGWQAHVLGEGRFFPSAMQAIETFRAEKPSIVDQELPPFVIAKNNMPIGQIKDHDAVIAYNFRGDRMLEVVQAFEEPEFSKFDRRHFPQVLFAGMMQYDGDTKRPKQFLVTPPHITCTLSELLCQQGISQLACAETQKFGHVTYFWNGNRTGKFNESLETYIEVPSYAPPFDGKPEMRAPEVTNTIIQELDKGRFSFLRVNFANGDMVGHTGNLKATVQAVEAVDDAIGHLWAKIQKLNGTLVVTADHGNADDMAERNAKTHKLLRDGQGNLIPKTAHSLNPVVFHIWTPPQIQKRLSLNPVDKPGLGNAASTLAYLLGYQPPAEFLPSLMQID